MALLSLLPFIHPIAIDDADKADQQEDDGRTCEARYATAAQEACQPRWHESHQNCAIQNITIEWQGRAEALTA